MEIMIETEDMAEQWVATMEIMIDLDITVVVATEEIMIDPWDMEEIMVEAMEITIEIEV